MLLMQKDDPLSDWLNQTHQKHFKTSDIYTYSMRHNMINMSYTVTDIPKEI